ncbi:hypothetical protein ABZ656_29435 [Streptomyces sp. NPDC007095]|uniref:hypothetical protein n=1 Tax=Streptomyces sp. NPDC007095 TaxID=3154482 RepID=UPI0033CC7014
MTPTQPGAYPSPSDAAAALLAAHPSLSADSVDVADVRGLGLAALIQVENRSALRAWAQALNAPARVTGASGYGTTEPHQAGLPDWLWWRVAFIDTAVDQTPVRLWTLETSAQPRALATLLACTAHAAT